MTIDPNLTPAERRAAVREYMARESGKLPAVDANGVPIAGRLGALQANHSVGSPPKADTTGAPPEPVRRAPAPNPAAGTSGNGSPSVDDDIQAALARGDFGAAQWLRNLKAAEANWTRAAAGLNR